MGLGLKGRTWAHPKRQEERGSPFPEEQGGPHAPEGEWEEVAFGYVSCCRSQPGLKIGTVGLRFNRGTSASGAKRRGQPIPRGLGRECMQQ